MSTVKLFLVALTIVVGVLSTSVQSVRVLAILPAYAKSHHRFHQAVLKTLVRAGHEVVVYSPIPLDQPLANYTDVTIDSPTWMANLNKIIIETTNHPHYKCLDIIDDVAGYMYQDFISNDKVKELLNKISYSSKQRFDLVITEAFTGQEYALIAGHVFNAPIIVLQAFTTNNIVNAFTGNSLSVSHIPDTCSPFSNKMSLFERFLNSFYVFRNLYYVYYIKHLPAVEAKLQRNFPKAPPLWEMIQNVSLVFVNDHQLEDYAQPRSPNIVPIAGIHIEDVKPLPKDILQFLDNAPDGAILFSLGTFVPDELQETEYFNMYIRVFGKLKQRVLWKTRKENIQGLPDNVMTLNWAPQRDILAHPKIVLFITHGGLLSQHETVHCGVPVVVIPQFFDQHRNAKFYEEKGVGVKVNIPDLSETTITAAIREVLDNPVYAKNMKQLSEMFRDRPMTPAETVVYWTEYVLRHGGSHLKPASAKLAWYQLILLDVLAAVLSVCVMIYYIIRTLFRFICCGKKENNKLSQRKKQS